MPTKKNGGETGYANNKLQWFLEKVVLPRTNDELGELAQEMYEEMHSRGWSSDAVDWKVVEQNLSRFLASQVSGIVEKLRYELSNEQGY